MSFGLLPFFYRTVHNRDVLEVLLRSTTQLSSLAPEDQCQGERQERRAGRPVPGPMGAVRRRR